MWFWLARKLSLGNNELKIIESLECNIITIGDEILIGQITDTNQPWIAQRLNEIGISVRQMLSVSDSAEAITNALDESFEKVDLVIITGGLGPTNDDITKKTITNYFGDTLTLNQEVAEHLKKLFAGMNFEFRENDLLQAMLPSQAKLFSNKIGTASGMWFEKENKIAISLPGVPAEMKQLMSQGVIPALRKTYQLPYILHKTLITYGLRESEMAIRLEPFEKQLPAHIKLAYLPNYRKLRLRLTAKGNEQVILEKDLSEQAQLLASYLTDIVVGYEDFLLEAEIGRLLTTHRKTLATAESFTGGNIAHLITMIPGASRYFKGSIIAYTAHIKEQELNINKKLITNHTVVSAEVAEAMALGVLNKFDTDYAIATTGNAGPTTDETDKSIGDIYIAIASKQGVKSYYFNLGQPREKVIYRGTSKALELLYKEILKTIV
jgi:nicotinamide-nucleotide amidase